MTKQAVLGIDIGGSGIKGAPVDLVKAIRRQAPAYPTPTPSTPKKVAGVVARISRRSPTTRRRTRRCDAAHRRDPRRLPVAAKIDKSWIDAPAEQIFSERLGRAVHVVSTTRTPPHRRGEVRRGQGAPRSGDRHHPSGRGSASAVIMDGVLVPNSELGHIEIDGRDAETEASAGAKTRLGLSYEDYIPRLQRYYETIEKLFSPDLIVVGGGISKDSAKYLPYLKLNAEIVPATLKNRAGIIGAAWLAADSVAHPDALA